MKKLLYVSFFVLLIVNCSKSSDQKTEDEKEVDVSEGQTNWAKYTYSDTIAGPHSPLVSGFDISVYDIAIRGNHVVMGGRYKPYDDYARVWESTDAGLTWKTTFEGSCCLYIYNISFPTDNVIYALSNCSQNLRLFKSINGEWSTIDLNFTQIFGSSPMHFFNENVGIVGNIKTIDGGESWHVIEDLKEYDGNHNSIRSKFFFDAQIGYCVSSTTVFKTTNGGDNWTMLYESTETLEELTFLNETVGFLRTWQGLLKTEDGGLTWRSVFTGQIKDMSFATNTIGIITGLKGLYKTVDVGESWELNYTSEFFAFDWDYTGPTHFAPSII